MLLRDLPQPPEVGVAWAAVVQDDRRTGQQTGDEQVPHHPAGGGEPEEPLAWAEIVMEPERLQMLDDDSAVPMHDPFGESRRARGVQDPERMVERHRVVFEWTRLGCQFRPAGCTIQLGGSVQVGHQHSCGQARYLLTQCPYASPVRRTPYPRSGSRRLRGIPLVPAGRTDRARHVSRSPVSTTTTSPRGSRQRGKPPAPRRSWAIERLPGHRGLGRAEAARRVPCRPVGGARRM